MLSSIETIVAHLWKKNWFKKTTFRNLKNFFLIVFLEIKFFLTLFLEMYNRPICYFQNAFFEKIFCYATPGIFIFSWNSISMQHETKLEDIQRRATKMVVKTRTMEWGEWWKSSVGKEVVQPNSAHYWYMIGLTSVSYDLD